MDPQIRKQRTFEAIKRLLTRESLNQPLILVFEDLHWLDAETQAFLTLLSESLATARLLLLVNYRPEYRHEWGSKTFYTQLRLDPLGQEDAQELLTTLLGDVGAQHAAPLRQFILEKTEGNPFFMEEIVQALVEQGVLDRGVGARLRPGFSAGHVPLPQDLHIPTTVQAVLASRIDRLPPPEKELLQTLSVLGKEFSLSLIQQVVGQSEHALQPLLSHLQGAEFIYEQPAFPEVEYIFKHALTQEVAYGSLLIERRKVLHERAAQAIEALFHSQLEDHYGDLAYHYSRSGNTQKAIAYLHLAGQQAVQGSAHEQAVTHLAAALRLLETLPDTPQRAAQELRLQITLGPALMITKGYGAVEVEQVYTRARALCQQVGETPQLFPVLWGLSGFYRNRGNLRTSYELAKQCLTLAERVQSQVFLCAAHRTLGTTLFMLGELSAGQRHLEQAIALYDPHQFESHAFLYGQDLRVVCLSVMAVGLYALGYPAQALAKSHEALTLAREQPRLHGLAFAEVTAALFHQHRQDVEHAQQRAEAAISLSTEHGFRAWEVQGSILRGCALAEQGQTEEGIAQICHGLATNHAGTHSFRVESLGLLARVYTKVGQREEGLRTVAEALTMVDEAGSHFYVAELWRLKGTLTLQSKTSLGQVSDKSQASQDMSEVPSTQHPTFSTPAEVEAEACFLKAIEIACRQQAKSWELRASTSLARLWQSQGKKEEARQMLAEIYNWFTEGFDTKDLQEAKALLEKLG